VHWRGPALVDERRRFLWLLEHAHPYMCPGNGRIVQQQREGLRVQGCEDVCRWFTLNHVRIRNNWAPLDNLVGKSCIEAVMYFARTGMYHRAIEMISVKQWADCLRNSARAGKEPLRALHMTDTIPVGDPVNKCPRRLQRAAAARNCMQTVYSKHSAAPPFVRPGCDRGTGLG